MPRATGTRQENEEEEQLDGHVTRRERSRGVEGRARGKEREERVRGHEESYGWQRAGYGAWACRNLGAEAGAWGSWVLRPREDAGRRRRRRRREYSSKVLIHRRQWLSAPHTPPPNTHALPYTLTALTCTLTPHYTTNFFKTRHQRLATPALPSAVRQAAASRRPARPSGQTRILTNKTKQTHAQKPARSPQVP